MKRFEVTAIPYTTARAERFVNKDLSSWFDWLLVTN